MSEVWEISKRTGIAVEQ